MRNKVQDVEQALLDIWPGDPPGKEAVKALAIAAILALKNPTTQMCRAAGRATDKAKEGKDTWFTNSEKHALRFNAMLERAVQIDAKLNIGEA